MRAILPRAALLAFAIAAALSTPAVASPKTDCEAALEKAEARFNAGVDRNAVSKVRESIANAREAHDEGKFKKCTAVAKRIVSQLGAN